MTRRGSFEPMFIPVLLILIPILMVAGFYLSMLFWTFIDFFVDFSSLGQAFHAPENNLDYNQLWWLSFFSAFLFGSAAGSSSK